MEHRILAFDSLPYLPLLLSFAFVTTFTIKPSSEGSCCKAVASSASLAFSNLLPLASLPYEQAFKCTPQEAVEGIKAFPQEASDEQKDLSIAFFIAVAQQKFLQMDRLLMVRSGEKLELEFEGEVE